MRIVHLSTSKTGGAGIIAKKLSQIQCEAGHDSQVLVRPSIESYKERITSKLNTLFSLKSATKNYHQITPLSVSSFRLESLHDLNPEIVYIHNWFNYLNFGNLREITNNFKTVFVLHDERLLTGGCHVTLGCDGYLNFCERCPASRVPGLVAFSKNYLSDEISKFGKFGVVTPSKWLEMKVERSQLGKASSVTAVIPNPVSSASVQVQQEKNFSGGIAEALFVSSDISIPYKGLKLLLKSLANLNLSSCKYKGLNVTVLGSKNQCVVDLENGVSLEYKSVVTESEMQNLYAKSQFLLLPSASENHPGVINEAQLSGVIVIATNVGGISEMIVDSESGFLSKDSPLDFQFSIERALNTHSLESIAAHARNEAQYRTNSERIVNLHNRLIESLINE